MNTADEISSTFSTQVVVLFLKLESRPDLCPVNEYLVQTPSLKIIYCKPFWPWELSFCELQLLAVTPLVQAFDVIISVFFTPSRYIAEESNKISLNCPLPRLNTFKCPSLSAGKYLSPHPPWQLLSALPPVRPYLLLSFRDQNWTWYSKGKPQS